MWTKIRGTHNVEPRIDQAESWRPPILLIIHLSTCRDSGSRHCN